MHEKACTKQVSCKYRKVGEKTCRICWQVENIHMHIYNKRKEGRMVGREKANEKQHI